MNDTIPVAKRLIGILEYCASEMGKTIALWGASITLPMPWFSGDRINLLSPATRAADAVWPALADEISATGFLMREHPFELGDGQLMDLRALFCSSHGGDLSSVGKTVG